MTAAVEPARVCPSWCVLPAGHRHNLPVDFVRRGECIAVHSAGRTDHGEDEDWPVEVVWFEYEPDHLDGVQDPPYIRTDYGLMDSALARSQAAALIAAADLADPEPITPSEQHATVTGIDGKSHQPQSTRKPSRKPITNEAEKVGWELRRATDRLAKLVTRRSIRCSRSDLPD